MTTRSTKPVGSSHQPDPGGRAGGTEVNGGGSKSPPTDLELMMYFDGELDGARSHDLLGWVRTDPGARSKLQALHIVSEVLREQAASSSSADNIADLVMGRIAAGEPPAPLPAEPARNDLTVGRISVHGRAANDNSRGIFALAAIAVAAAAALMVWGRMAPESTSPESPSPVAAVATTSEPAAEPAPPVHVEAPVSDAEDGPGVEVAAVDFGTRTGTIFYVPTDADSSKHTTTVVWLADDVGGQ